VHRILLHLDHPDNIALPDIEDYSSFHLSVSPNSSVPSESNEIDPEDDAELWTELSALERLRIYKDSHVAAPPEEDVEPQPNVVVDKANDEGGSSDTDIFTPVALHDHTIEAVESDIASGKPLVNQPRTMSIGSTSCNGSIHEAVLSEDEECVAEKFWSSNPCPPGLPPIKTIFDALVSPFQSIQQQRPVKIWKEIMDLYLPMMEQVSLALYYSMQLSLY